MGKKDNIVGKVYGRLSVVSQAGKNKNQKYMVNCTCECGNTCQVMEALLKDGRTTSCGCRKSEVTSERCKVDFTGIKSGRLTMLEDVGSQKGQRLWLCQCDCGNMHTAIGSNVAVGHTLSCGCLHADNTAAANTTHGMSGTKEYWTYNTMLSRCYNENSEKYEIYGARGIVVCPEWQESFENFYKDMGAKPKGLTLERVDVNKNYCKENCIWDTPTEQAYNQRRRKDNTSGRVGVYLLRGMWVARIWKDKQCYDLGKFASYEEAVSAREKGEMEHYGYLKDKI